ARRRRARPRSARTRGRGRASGVVRRSGPGSYGLEPFDVVDRCGSVGCEDGADPGTDISGPEETMEHHGVGAVEAYERVRDRRGERLAVDGAMGGRPGLDDALRAALRVRRERSEAPFAEDPCGHVRDAAMRAP